MSKRQKGLKIPKVNPDSPKEKCLYKTAKYF